MRTMQIYYGGKLSNDLARVAITYVKEKSEEANILKYSNLSMDLTHKNAL